MYSGYKPPRTAVFISGGGSTLQALLEQQHHLAPSLVVTSRKNAAGVLKARRFGVPVEYFHREMTFAELGQLLTRCRIEKIILAGFMKILPPDFVEAWRGRILNIHPSLLPDFPGLDSLKRSWTAGGTMGVTIHEVTEEMDAGQPLLRMSSLATASDCEFSEAGLLLRRTEQALLRDAVVRYF